MFPNRYGRPILFVNEGAVNTFPASLGSRSPLIPHGVTMQRVLSQLLVASQALFRAVLAIAIAAGTPAAAQSPSWLEAYPPFRIAPDLYYVGSRGLASYLVTTLDGHILINSNLEASVPMIRSSVEALGFRFADIRILLISHAHYDHNAGSARIKELTGARYMVMEGDVSAVESGGRTDFQYGSDTAQHYPVARVDRVLRDGDEVKLGGKVLTARLTPGHTRGTTTWTLKVSEGGRTSDVVIIGSPNVNPGYRLVGNASYPKITEDFEQTFRVLKSLPVDYFLGAHGSYFDMEKKHSQLSERGPSPFIDRAGYLAYVNDRERAFRAELARQRRGSR